MKAYFGNLEIGQKFHHPDFQEKVMERVCGNAAAFVPHQGMLVTIEQAEQVTIVGEG